MNHKLYLKNAAWIHDSEFDDSTLAKMLIDLYGQLPYPRLRICTPSKDDKKIKPLKEKMWVSMIKEKESDICFWKDHYSYDNIKNFMNHCEKRMIDNKIILIVTAPTYGLIRSLTNLTQLPLIIYMYTGIYNSNGSPEIDDLLAEQKITLIEFSRYYLLDTVVSANVGTNNDELIDLKHLGTLLDIEFWEKFEQCQPERYHAIREFLEVFNMSLVHPKRLIEKPNDDELKELIKLYKTNFEEYRHKIDLKNCIPKKIPILESIGKVRLSAPICDVMIGWFVYMIENNITQDFNIEDMGNNRYVWKVSNVEKYVPLFKRLIKDALLK